MSKAWLYDKPNSNSLNKSYMKDFLDVSGDIYIRNGNIYGINADISMNGTLVCNSLTLTESTGAGINSDVQTALDGKQDALITGSGVSLIGDTLNVTGGNENIGQNQSVTYQNSVLINTTLAETDFYNPALYGVGGYTAFGLNTTAVSGDGNTISSGWTAADANLSINTNEGGAVVFKTDDNGLTWSLKGAMPQIFGPSKSSIGGYQGWQNMSYDGNTLMLGTSRWVETSTTNYLSMCIIYKFNGTSWVQKGQVLGGLYYDKINGAWVMNNTQDHTGGQIRSGDIRNNGNTIFTGSYWDPPSKIHIWDYNDTTNLWVLRNVLTKDYNVSWGFSSHPATTYFGLYEGSARMTEDGNTMAIGSWQVGKVIVIDYYDGDWHLRSVLTGSSAYRFGINVAITDDSKVLLIASSLGPTKLGVYDWNGANWVQRGVNFGTGSRLGEKHTRIIANGNYAVATTHETTTTSTFIYYWSGVGWNTVSGTPINYGSATTGGARFGCSWGNTIRISLGGAAYELKVYELSSTTSNTTDISGNLDIYGNLNVSGGDIIVNGSTVHYSDIRLKSNIEVLQNSLNNISKLNPEIYNKKKTINEQLTLTNTESGFVAQDIWYNIPELRHLVVLPDGVRVEDILDMSFNRVKPEWIDMYDISTNGIIDVLTNQIIHTNEDGTTTYEEIVDPNDYSDKTPDYESYGWSNKPASVNYEGLIAYLVGAIQELKEKITIQSSEIDVLVG